MDVSEFTAIRSGHKSCAIIIDCAKPWTATIDNLILQEWACPPGADEKECGKLHRWSLKQAGPARCCSGMSLTSNSF